MTVAEPVVVVGAGQGGLQVATSLRAGGYTGAITVVGDEPGLPYQRPPLSKDYLLGRVERHAIDLRPEHWFDQHDVQRVTATVTGLDRRARDVVLDSGRRLPYGHVVLATGARIRVLPVSGVDQAGVHMLRTDRDAAALRVALRTGGRVVVVGGGFIGLEIAAVAHELGRVVTVLEAGPRLMARAVTPRLSEVILAMHRSQGIRVELGVTVTGLCGRHGQVRSVATADGRVIPADLVVVGIGVVPETGLAERAGLAVGDGVLVDGHLRTSDPSISAIGDCARHLGPDGATLRLESVQNATDQARCVAARIGGTGRAYRSVPWFWSHQHGHTLQMAGLVSGHDDVVVRGDLRTGAVSLFAYRAGRLLGVESVDRPADHAAARRLLAADDGRCPPLVAADPSADLRALAGSPPSPKHRPVQTRPCRTRPPEGAPCA